jgi:hypothetical protein
VQYFVRIALVTLAAMAVGALASGAAQTASETGFRPARRNASDRAKEAPFDRGQSKLFTSSVGRGPRAARST